MATWVIFTDGSRGCAEIPREIEEQGGEARVAFVEALPNAAGRKVSTLERLPYPAHPRLNATDTITKSGRNIGPCPSFCYRPESCAGHSSCPRSPSCVD